MRGATMLAVILLASIAGCAGDERADSQCVAAFRDAEPRAEPPYEVSPLDDAVKRCQTVEEWQDAWDRVPQAHPAERDAILYLGQRCAVEVLRPTELCRDLAERAAEPPRAAIRAPRSTGA
jgi:hypothetical protein